MRRSWVGSVALALAFAGAFWWQAREGTPPAPQRSDEPNKTLGVAAPEPRPGLNAPPGSSGAATPGGPGVAQPAAPQPPEPQPPEPSSEPPATPEAPSPQVKPPISPGAPVAQLAPSRDGAAPKHVYNADAAGIRGAVQESLPDLKECYEEWQKSAPGLRGRVAVSFQIEAALDLDAGSAPEGRVGHVRIGESELDHVFMEGCVSSVFSELHFTPPADGKLAVTYPIQFESKDPPPPPP